MILHIPVMVYNKSAEQNVTPPVPPFSTSTIFITGRHRHRKPSLMGSDLVWRAIGVLLALWR